MSSSSPDGSLSCASEDIGLANPNAFLMATACFQAVHVIGLPESRIILSETTIYLASSPKSNSAYMAIDKAAGIVRKTGNLPVPLHLRNAPTKLMKDLGYGERIQVCPFLSRIISSMRIISRKSSKKGIFMSPERMPAKRNTKTG